MVPSANWNHSTLPLTVSTPSVAAPRAWVTMRSVPMKTKSYSSRSPEKTAVS